MELFWRTVLVLLATWAIYLIYRVTRLFKLEIPPLNTQRDNGYAILRRGTVGTDEEKAEIQEDFEDYFLGIKVLMLKAIFDYALLNIAIFLMFQLILSYAPTPQPGPYVVSKWLVSAVVTLIVTSSGWVVMIVKKGASASLKEDIMGYFVTLGFFEPNN